MSEAEKTFEEKKEGEDSSSLSSKYNDHRRSAFQKSEKSAQLEAVAHQSGKNEEKVQKTCFEISKQSKVPPFEKWKNYYIEYWNVFKKNEVVLAKIKETSLEINCMKAHLEELKSLQSKKNHSNNNSSI